MTTEQLEDPEGRALVDAIHERKRQGIGETVGYVPLELDRYGGWITLPGADRVDSIVKAVAWIDAFKKARQGAAAPGTYAVGKVSLAMVDRPDQ